jgi:hypothetical protein
MIQVKGFTLNQAGLLNDGKTVWFRGSEPGKGQRYYLTDLNGAAPRAITPEGVSVRVNGFGPVLNGEYFAATSGGRVMLYPVRGGEPQTAVGLTPGTGIAGWSSDGRELYVFNGSRIPVAVDRLDWKSGKREPLLEINPADRAGLRGVNTLRVSADGKNYVYSVPQQLEELHSVEGLK